MAYYYIFNSVFLDKFSLCYILKGQTIAKLHEEILHINYQLLPMVTMVMLVIKAVINVRG